MIELRNISKSYDGTHNVVNDLSLTIPESSVFGFLGPNGAGKTTTIKMLVGINAPDSGEIRIDGDSPQKASARQNIGFMPEEPSFYHQLTGLEFMQFANSLFDKDRRSSPEELRKLLRKTGIAEAADKKIRTYSKGMKQRLGFAQAMVSDPKYIFLDEPLEGLDPIGRRELKVIVEDLKKEGKTIFFNSHILADVEVLCDKIGIIHRGQLIYSGPVQEFRQNRPLEDKFVETIKNLENE